MEPWVASQLPNLMSVTGPTLGWTFDFISIEPGNTAGEILQSIAASQKSDSEHCHAPWDSIIKGLGPDRGRLVHDVISARNLVSWDPSAQRRAQSKQQRFLELQSRSLFLDYLLFWNFGLESPSRIAAFALYDDVHLGRGEVSSHLEYVQEFVTWLADVGNWNRAVGDGL